MGKVDFIEIDSHKLEKVPKNIFDQDLSKSFLELYSSDDLSSAACFINMRRRLIQTLFVYILFAAIMFFSHETILPLVSVPPLIFIYKLYNIKYGNDLEKAGKDMFWSTIVLMLTALVVGAYAMFFMLSKGNSWGWLFAVVAVLEAYCSFIIYSKGYEMLRLMEPIRSVQSIMVLEEIEKFLAKYDFDTDDRVVRFHYVHGMSDEKMTGLLLERYGMFRGALGTILIIDKSDFEMRRVKKFPLEARYNAKFMVAGKKMKVNLKRNSILRFAIWKARSQ